MDSSCPKLGSDIQPVVNNVWRQSDTMITYYLHNTFDAWRHLLSLEDTQCICLLDLLTVVGETFNVTALAVAEGNSLSPLLLSIDMALHLIFSPIERPDFLSPGPLVIMVYCGIKT